MKILFVLIFSCLNVYAADISGSWDLTFASNKYRVVIVDVDEFDYDIGNRFNITFTNDAGWISQSYLLLHGDIDENGNQGVGLFALVGLAHGVHQVYTFTIDTFTVNDLSGNYSYTAGELTKLNNGFTLNRVQDDHKSEDIEKQTL